MGINNTDRDDRRDDAWVAYLRARDKTLRARGIDITAVDDSDFVGWAASASRLGEIYFDSVASMVANVLKKRLHYPIRRLNIIDHGNPQSFTIGDDWISLDGLPKFEKELSKLRSAFGPSGFVHLQHCDIGMNKELLVKLARIWDVPIYAGTGKHNPLFRFNFGDYVRANPNGTVRPAGRPDEDTFMREIVLDLPMERPEVMMRSSSVAYETVPPPPPKPKLIRRATRR